MTSDLPPSTPTSGLTALCCDDDAVVELCDGDWGNVLCSEDKGLHNRPFLLWTNATALLAAASGLSASPLPVAQSGLSQFDFPHPSVSCLKNFWMSSLSAALQGDTDVLMSCGRR